MNILHHKSWHVRNKDNILRVKRDEENARKEEEEQQKKAALAESEVRIELLRKKLRKTEDHEPDSDLKNTSSSSKSGHINFFAELEEGKKEAKCNEEYEKEKKAAQEKHEKAIGLLTYLGQTSLDEKHKDKPWSLGRLGKTKLESEKETKFKSRQSEELNLKFKQSLDPLHMMNKYMVTKRKIEDKDALPKARVIQPNVKQEIKPAQLLKTEGKSSDNPHTLKKRKKKRKKEKEKRLLKKLKKEKRQKKKKSRNKCKDESSSSDNDRVSSKRKKSELLSLSRKRKYSNDTDNEPNTKRGHKRRRRNSSNSSSTCSEVEKDKSLPSCSGPSLAQLRAERLRREQEEQTKTKKLFDKMNGVEEKQEQIVDDRDRKYNSVFNPEFVRKKRPKRDYSDL